ncbi:MAG TPA: C4-type zinc ribbon domain-containing protein [Terriglobales bacterium]|nr:C4-type zinc ribbon domain-containing protein [Terriglobales bacterium]
MNPDLSKLIDLQKADAEISRLNTEIASLPKKVAAIEEKLAGSKDRAEKAKAALKADESARRKHEGDIEALRQKISKYRDQMLNVKTNQEYAALGKEVEFAQQEIGKLEDKILETMMDSDSKNADLKKAEAELKAHAAEIEKEKAVVRELSADDEKELGDWKGKRDALRGSIGSDALRHYDRVLKFRGSAIAEAIDHKCSACQVMLRPQVYNNIRSTDEFITCDSCHRILFYDPAHDNDPILPKPVASSEPEQADNAAAQ